MRQIKFRAQDIASNKWLYGDLRHHKDDVCIFEQGGTKGEQVKRDTIGQYTGMKDKNGVGIYEGDIVRYNDNSDADYIRYGDVEDVAFIDGCFYPVSETWCQDIEVIGNKYDNPDLLTK